MINTVRSPIIIVGMHRSGTSLITRVLEEAGLFVGKQKEGNCEAWLFLLINRWVLKKSGGRWDNPKCIEELINNEDLMNLYAKFISRVLQSPLGISYFGGVKYFSGKRFSNLETPWGWKDPRNSLTLPVWLKIFPKAKIINIKRNGVDVAQSLKVRYVKAITNAIEQSKFSNLKHYMRVYHGEYASPSIISSVEKGLGLWDYYNDVLESTLKKCECSILTLKYEDFLDEPVLAAKKLLDFCELDSGDVGALGLLGNLNVKRKNAFLDNKELLKLIEEYSHILSKHGY